MACGSILERPSRGRGIGTIILGGLIALLAGCLFNEDREARGSIVENEIVGFITTADGAPSIGARVQLYPADSADGPQLIAISEVITDTKGEYRFSKIKSGVYSLIGQHDTLLAFHDSIEVNAMTGAPNNVQILQPDTLRATGAISVRIILRPGDDPTSISGEVLGTGFGAHAQGTGDLSMFGMPAGRLRIRFKSSLAGYKPLDIAVDVAPGKTSRAGPLVLPY